MKLVYTLKACARSADLSTVEDDVILSADAASLWLYNDTVEDALEFLNDDGPAPGFIRQFERLQYGQGDDGLVLAITFSVNREPTTIEVDAMVPMVMQYEEALVGPDGWFVDFDYGSFYLSMDSATKRPLRIELVM